MRSPPLAATIEIMRQNVFVLGLNDANRDVLHALPGSEQITFHQLLTQEELQEGEVDVLELLARAQEQLDAFDGSIDAIVNFWDFPATMMLPVLCQRRGLPAADLLAVLRCEHKYWSRLVQSRVTEALPAFGLLDLDAEQPHLPAGVSYPVWIKPVESASSEGPTGSRTTTSSPRPCPGRGRRCCGWAARSRPSWNSWSFRRRSSRSAAPRTWSKRSPMGSR